MRLGVKKFKLYLLNVSLSENTSNSYVRRVEMFLQWIEEESMNLKKVNYNDILKYVNHLQQRDIGKRMINCDVKCIRYYFDFLQLKNNPTNGIKIRGMVKTIPKDLLEQQQLDDLYNNFEHNSFSQLRDKVILGLLVYQGVTKGDLQSMKKQDVNLKTGDILIRERGTTNRRILKLQPNQIVDFYHYISEVEENKLSESDLLFQSCGQSGNLNGVTYLLTKRIVKNNEHIINLNQIRSSVISLWMKKYNLREVQYMAGHKYVSSTEKYKKADLTDLHNDLMKYFPFKKKR